MNRRHSLSALRPDRRAFLKACAAAAATALTSNAWPEPASPGGVYLPAATKKMAALLREIYEQSDWKADPDKTAQRAAYYRSLLRNPLTPTQQVTVWLEMGKELLRTGECAEARHTLQELARTCQERGFLLPDDTDRQIQMYIALSCLRLGELENSPAILAEATLSPGTAAPPASSPQGAAAEAAKAFGGMLNEDSHDSLSRWLLNIACMLSGGYPQSVPARWLVPERLFESEFDIGNFPDVAAQAGVNCVGHAGGVLLEDFDGDGLLDLMISSSGPMDQLRFFHNNGDGTFTDRTAQAGLLGEVGGLNIVLTDYNNDGHPDVLVLRGGWLHRFGEYPMSLLRNNANGTFDDVTEAAGLLSRHPTQTAAWADYDNDGWLDLFVGVESTPDNPHVSQLFHNNGDGTFTEVAAPNGLADLGWVKGVAWGDFNNDGRPDLYVSVLDGPNRLFRNDGPRDPHRPRPDQWQFTDVSKQAGVTEPHRSFATWFFDYDNDGWPDIFAAGYAMDSIQDMAAFEMGMTFHAELPRLYRNNRDGTFTDVTRAVHLDRVILPMGANFGDLDNDGWLDIYLGTGDPSYQSLLPNRMFRNHEGRVFQDVTRSGGFGHLQKGHGIAFGDIENNGNEDIFEVIGGHLPGDLYESVLFRNPGHGNHWITLVLEGVKTNRAAFGARIALKFVDGGVQRQVFRTVGCVSSFGGNPLRQHIGVGKASSINRIEIFWPASGSTQVFTNIAINRAFHVREGAEKLEPVTYRQFTFDAVPMAKNAVGMQFERRTRT
ncbi:MAG TPA: CRTAC1 family protein [Terracidiphilus sp.]|nr:CRTAC1 family protein [Terracidiphilus sp.]